MQEKNIKGHPPGKKEASARKNSFWMSPRSLIVDA